MQTIRGTSEHKQPSYHPKKMWSDDSTDSSSSPAAKVDPSPRVSRSVVRSGKRDKVVPVSDDEPEVAPIFTSIVAGLPLEQEVTYNFSYSSCSKCDTKHQALHYVKPPEKVSWQEITDATDGFATGAFREETLYRGKRHNVPVYVALRQGEEKLNFFSEVSILKSLRHRNIINLKGFCEEDSSSQAIVFNYFCNRNLHYHLVPDDLPNPKLSLPWQTRTNVAIELAKGLIYLHADCSIIHGYINSLNVLLNHDFVPVIADFSLSRRTLDAHEVKLYDRSGGDKFKTPRKARGYLAPEYFDENSRTSFSEKQDIYAFGVILLELVTGLPAFLRKRRPKEFLVEWSREMIVEFLSRKHMLVDIMVDPRLSADSEYDVHTKRALCRMIMVAEICTQEDPRDRPSMTKVLELLLRGPPCQQY